MSVKNNCNAQIHKIFPASRNDLQLLLHNRRHLCGEEAWKHQKIIYSAAD